jgi:hypothetical protein
LNPSKALRAQVRNLGCDLQKFGSALRNNWIDFTGTVGSSVHDWIGATHPNDAIDSTTDPTYDSAQSFAGDLTDLGSSDTTLQRVQAIVETATTVGTSYITLSGNAMVRYVLTKGVFSWGRLMGSSGSPAAGEAATERADASTDAAVDAVVPAAAGDTSLAATNAEIAAAAGLDATPAG